MPPVQPQYPQPQNQPPQPAPASPNPAQVSNGQPEWYAQSPTPNQAPPPRKSKRTLIIVIVAVVIAGLIGAVIWYVLFSRPERAIGDALLNATKADHSTIKGTVSADLVSSTTGAKDKFTFTYAAAVAKDSFKASAVAGLTYGNVPLSIDGDIISTADGQGYVRINNIREIATQAIGDQPQALKELDPLLTLLDKKWVQLSQKELGAIAPSTSQDSTLSCVQKVQTQFGENSGLQSEVLSVFVANQFVLVDKTLDNESINGVDNVHYLLKTDKQKAVSFIKAFRSTQLYKKFNDCTSGQFGKDLPDDALTGIGDTSLEVWIGRWDHTFSRLRFVGKDRDGSTTLDINTDYRSAVNIQAPTSDITPFDTLKKAYEKFLPTQNAADKDTLLNPTTPGVGGGTKPAL